MRRHSIVLAAVVLYAVLVFVAGAYLGFSDNTPLEQNVQADGFDVEEPSNSSAAMNWALKAGLDNFSCTLVGSGELCGEEGRVHEDLEEDELPPLISGGIEP